MGEPLFLCECRYCGFATISLQVMLVHALYDCPHRTVAEQESTEP